MPHVALVDENNNNNNNINRNNSNHQKGVGRVMLPFLIFSLLCHSVALAHPATAASAGTTASTGTPASAPHDNTPQQTPQNDPEENGSSSSSSTPPATTTKTKDGALFVVCSVDGSIYALDAWSGQFLSNSRTGAPLLTRSMVSNKSKKGSGNYEGEPVKEKDNKEHADEAEDDDDNVHDEDDEHLTSSVIPGLDGKLYWQPNSDTGDQALQPLPISIPSLLENPVRSCDESGQNCGILTAVAHTTLLALDTETGDISWSTSPTAQSNNKPKSTSPTVLLQRKDFAIQQFSTKTGKELWNVTLGSYQAVDFEPPAANADPIKVQKIDDDDDLADDFIHDDDDNDTPNGRGEPILPSLLFGSGGRELYAISVDPETLEQNILWRVESPHVLTSVFGIHNHRWRAVHVLEDQEWRNPADNDNTIPYTRRLPSQASPAEMDYSQLWKQHHSTKHQPWHPEESRRGPQKALPSSFGNTEQALCLEGGECPRRAVGPASATALLGLPAPSPYMNHQPNGNAQYTPQYGQYGHQQQQQQFRSEHVVAILACTTVLLFLAWKVWKEPLAAEIVASPPPPQQMHVTHGNRTFLEDQTNGLIHETVSFPGAIRQKHKTDARTLPLELNFNAPDAPVQSDPGETETQPANQAINNNNATIASPNPHATTGGIPLVQYSRYASEFEEKEALGRGGFGSVFRCKNNLDGRDYAIKKVTIRGIKPGDEASFQQELSRVLREVKILAMLDHGNIVRYYTAWLEMEKDDKDEKSSGNKRQSEETSQSFGRSFNLHDSESTSSSIWQASSSSMSQDQSSSWNGHFRRNKFGSSPSRAWQNRQNFNTPSHLDDCGVIFEDSTGVDLADGGNEPSQRISDSRDSADTSFSRGQAIRRPSSKIESTTSNTDQASDGTAMKHTLYIQMELCNIDTIADFLANKKARETFATANQSSAGTVNVSKALALLLQIAKAVDYVHGKGLIHRDLKPSNCFMDNSGVVKVGDFGLSRETSGDQQSENAIISSILSDLGSHDEEDACDDDHTAGVGTRMYASPEQTEGSSYDSSTDVFSLGIMLFELCYPMYTGMERNICLSKLRQQRQFPSDWDAVVGAHAASIKGLLLSMLEPRASGRPSASGVVQQIKDLMGELTILSPTTLTNTSDLILLRVESTCEVNPLQDAINHINEAAEPHGPVHILQSGMARENERVTAMEFAMQSSLVDGTKLVKHLRQVPQMSLVREVVLHQHSTVDYESSSSASGIKTSSAD